MATIMVTTTGSLLHGVSTTHNHRLHHLPHRRFPSLSLPKPALNPLPPFTINPSKPPFLCFSSLNPTIPSNPSPKTPLISNSTKTLATLFALSLSFTSKIAQILSDSISKFRSFCQTPTAQELQYIQYLQDNVFCTIGPLFFAAVKDRSSAYLNTPLTVVAAGMAKWLDIYSGVLLVRVLLSWFPNIPWDRQPLSAIRDLCDPYLNLFRNIIPPVFDTLDISPLFAFTVLGILGSILSSAKGI